MTLRWACRKGDFIFWAKFQGIFSSRGNEFQIADIWQLRDGNFVTITNRHADLPEWFDLHPLEVSGRLVYWMQKRLDEGHQPQEPIDGPNIWRVLAGDRIAWVGQARDGIESAGAGVLGLLDFHNNALIYGEPFDMCQGIPGFGFFDRGELYPEEERWCRAGWDAIKSLGFPRTAAADGQWRIG